ncbi:Uncharacterised protein [Vibrio cholerae]|nr:Uncharacterised protein [Vibrio cholerae]
MLQADSVACRRSDLVLSGFSAVEIRRITNDCGKAFAGLPVQNIGMLAFGEALRAH